LNPNTTQNNPNLSTLFLANGVLRAKCNLNYLYSSPPKSPPKEVPRKNNKQEKRLAAKTCEQGAARRHVGMATAALEQQPNPPSCCPIGPSREAYFPLFTLVLPFLVELA